MQIIKQKGRRWLSGLLALIMIAGLFPATGITASAAGGGAPETIQMNKAAYASAGPFTDPNLTSSNSNYNHSAYMRVFYMQVGDNEVPGFCGNHDLDVHYKPHTWTWKDGESIRTAEGGKYMPGYEFYKRYVAEYLMSNYIRDNCGITAGNWKKWKEENQPNNDKIKNLENAIQAWADENGYGWFAYLPDDIPVFSAVGGQSGGAAQLAPVDHSGVPNPSLVSCAGTWGGKDSWADRPAGRKHGCAFHPGLGIQFFAVANAIAAPAVPSCSNWTGLD